MIRYAKGSYIITPNKEALRGQKPIVQLVFVWLCAYADDDGLCYPNRETLATDCGSTVRTIDRALKELVVLGLLRKEPRYNHVRVQTSNLYSILLVATSDSQGDNNDTLGRQKQHGEGDKNSTHVGRQKRHTNSTNNSTNRTTGTAFVVDTFKRLQTAFGQPGTNLAMWEGNVAEAIKETEMLGFTVDDLVAAAKMFRDQNEEFYTKQKYSYMEKFFGRKDNFKTTKPRYVLALDQVGHEPSAALLPSESQAPKPKMKLNSIGWQERGEPQWILAEN